MRDIVKSIGEKKSLNIENPLKFSEMPIVGEFHFYVAQISPDEKTVILTTSLDDIIHRLSSSEADDFADFLMRLGF